jgi:hypothetical protein
MSKVSETLGALNFLGRYILKKSKSPVPGPTQEAPYRPNYVGHDSNYHGGGYYGLPPVAGSGSHSHEASKEDLVVAPSEAENVASPVLTVKPEEDAQLGNALYTLGRNVLGQVRDTHFLPRISLASKQ